MLTLFQCLSNLTFLSGHAVVVQCWQVLPWAQETTEVSAVLFYLLLVLLNFSNVILDVIDRPTTSLFSLLMFLNLDMICFCRTFFESLYRSLARGARAVLQMYPENIAQRELMLGFAIRAGFAGGIVVDYPHRWDEWFIWQSYPVFGFGFL